MISEKDYELNDEDKRNWEQYVIPIMSRAAKGLKPTGEEMGWIIPYEFILRRMFPSAWEIIDA